MTYLIDGHNLIGQMRDLSLDDPHDEVKLVERLKSFMARKGKRCVVVFDGGLPGGLERHLSNSSVQVVFAHGGTTADAIILERLHKLPNPASWTVVSGDQAIRQAAARRRVPVILPTAFAAQMRRPAAPVDDEDPYPRLSPQEIDEWLRLFGRDPDHK